MATTGQRLKELRIEKGWTQRQVADYCNIKRASYSNHELNVSKPSLQVLVLLARLFNVSMEYLTCVDDEKGDCNSIIAADDKYENVPLIDLYSSAHLRNIKTSHEKVLKGKYIYCYSPLSSIENRIKKNDLLLIQQKITPKTGDILLVKKGDDFIIGCSFKNNDDSILLFNNTNFSPKFITLDKTYTVIGIIKEITIRLRK